MHIFRFASLFAKESVFTASAQLPIPAVVTTVMSLTHTIYSPASPSASTIVSTASALPPMYAPATRVTR